MQRESIIYFIFQIKIPKIALFCFLNTQFFQTLHCTCNNDMSVAIVLGTDQYITLKFRKLDGFIDYQDLKIALFTDNLTL